MRLQAGSPSLQAGSPSFPGLYQLGTLLTPSALQACKWISHRRKFHARRTVEHSLSTLAHTVTVITQADQPLY
eukprot:515491-Hanusia_phi.AAC.1